MTYVFRPALTTDFELCRYFHHQGLKPYVEKLWGWDEEFQDKRFLEKFNFVDAKIIQVDGKDVGYLECDVRDKFLYIGNISLGEEFRGKGLGTLIFQDLIRTLDKNLLGLRLNVLSNNPARKLYERVGFKKISELDDKLRMEWRRS